MSKFIFKNLIAIILLLISIQISAQTQFEITFEVDMTYAQPFNPTTDDVYITGSFAGWVQPGTDNTYKLMPLEADSMLYTLTVMIDSGEIQYKYFRIIDEMASWDNGEWTGDPNRSVQITANEVIHDIWAEFADGWNITFDVDLTEADSFNPNTDDIYITGNFTSWVEPGTSTEFKLEPVEPGSLHYSLTILIENLNNIEYKYFRIIDEMASWDNGEWVGDLYREEAIGSSQTFFNVWADITNSYDITFEVDMTESDLFNPLTDDVYITGSFAAWAEPGTDTLYRMEPIEPGSMYYSITIPLVRGDIEYKYHRIIDNIPSWDYGEWTGEPSREEFIESTITFNNIWGVISEPMTYNVIFEVDMTEAFPFDPITEDVYITGSFANWSQPGTDTNFMMKPIQPGSMFYRLTVPIVAGEIIYKYFRVTTGIPSWDNGEWIGSPDRVEIIETSLTIYDIWGDILSDIDYEASEFTYRMYPNPVLTVLNFDNISDIKQIDIYDASGRMVRTVDVITDKVVIDVADFQTGVYIVNVSNERGTQSSKFIKN